MKRILPPLFMIISVLLMLILHITIPLYSIISFPLNLIGILLLIGGLAISAIGSNKFARVGTTKMTFDEPSVLVTDGLYKFSRNPMYLGMVLLVTGIWIVMGSFTPLVVAVFFIVIMDTWYIRFEEKMLSSMFGKKYEEYKKRVRRWM